MRKVASSFEQDDVKWGGFAGELRSEEQRGK